MHGDSRAKGYYCTMVRGPCRGALCDFWARIKIKNSSVEEIVAKFHESISECKKDNGGVSLDLALNQFWQDFGLKDLERMCSEEPVLCKKVEMVEEIVLSYALFM